MQPQHITLRHWQEWTDASCVDPTLASLNVETIEMGDRAYDFLFYDAKVPRINSGRLAAWIFKTYKTIEDGGWWCSGLDPLNNWEPMTWGRFKPNTPRSDFSKKQVVKYESPYKAPGRVTYFRVTLPIWETISQRSGVAMPDQVTVTADGEAIGFWTWLQAHPEIPIILTEGEKKAACLLSLGFAAIALPGIWMGTRKIEKHHVLHPDLIPMAQAERKLIIQFDYETKPKTCKQIYLASLRLGEAIEAQGCVCEVAVLPGKEKGIDDWVFALGDRAPKAVAALIGDAYSLSDYRASTFFNRCRGLQKYKPSLVVSSRYLSEAVQLPRSGFVVLVSNMGTGKTEIMVQWRESNPNERFLNNGHRINLLKNLSDRLQTESYAALSQGNLSYADALSITADSLYKLATQIQAYGCIFIDEACQYLAHLLFSKTCKEHQAEILEILEWLIYNAPLVVIADAHMDDATIDFFKAMRPEGEQPFIIKNTYQEPGRDCHWYGGKNSSAIVGAICAAAWAGQKAFVISDSKRFIKKLERILNGLPPSPDLRMDEEESETDKKLKIWAIHSENSGSEANVVFIRNIRYAIKEENVDFLLASPSLGTGIDMPDYHFDMIFGVFHAATQTATECVQGLWRYRLNVPMHVWVAPHPSFGFKSCNAQKIKQQILESNRLTAFLIRLDRQTGERGAEKDWALEAYCRIQAQRNYSINNLRADLKSLLEEMDTNIIMMGDEQDESAKQRLKDAGVAIDDEHFHAVANADWIDKATYLKRQKKEYLKPEEALECEKFRIFDTYGQEVTPELVERDDGGRYIPKIIALEELLEDPQAVDEDSILYPPAMIVQKDLAERKALPLCFHWKNRSTAWVARHLLGLDEIVRRLFAGEEFTGEENILQKLKTVADSHSNHIKAVLGVTIPPGQSPLWILALLLPQIGLKLKPHKVGRRGEQISYSPVDTELKDFSLKILEYRKSQRETKDRQQQKQREKNQEYAARMQAVYGIQPVSSPPLNALQEEFRGGLDTMPQHDEMELQSGAGNLADAISYGQEAIEDMLKPWQPLFRAEVLERLQSRSREIFDRLTDIMPGVWAWCS